MDRESIETLWTPIGQTSNQLILYHPPSHALSVRPHADIQPVAGPSRPLHQPLLLGYDPPTPFPAEICPYCSQPLPSSSQVPPTPGSAIGKQPYFQILERAHEGSRPPSPRLRRTSPTPTPDGREDEGGEVPSRGYYERFFKEETRLGMGAEGSVYLAAHIIGGNVLGTYAVKKIAVGDSKEYLVRMLREVRLLEALRHPNIIPYHHSWIEPTRFSSFGPPINALHVLMMYATAGNLDTYLIARTHAPPTRPDLSAGDIGDADSLGQLPKEERIKAFKKRRASSIAGDGARAGMREMGKKREENRGVLMPSWEEVLSLFGDVVEGLAFLHGNAILHLDLKCSNVLLHWEEGKLIPKAMISDFGTSEEMLLGQRQRTGHTGTMEYMAPETLMMDEKGQWRPTDSHADMWSLGMILHKLLFLHLPYPDTPDFDALLAEILRYPGFIPSSDLIQACERRHIPRDMLLLLSKLVHIDPNARASADKVRLGLRTFGSQRSRTASASGGVMAKFTKPLGRHMARFTGSPAPEVDTPSSDNDWHISPVRSILALPSPLSQSSLQLPETELPILKRPDYFQPVRSPTIPSAIWSYASEVRAAVFVLKILSIQPDVLHFVFGNSKSIRPITSMVLVLGALADLKVELWSFSLALLIVHIAACIAS